ncbi:MAG: DUF5682 family protein [Saprospiraceae bacterium]|nr:DUF5682 family protein [Saprospiraceae bacterium]MDW8228453.1 DUF5682 family protein [Saprospiraceae bacterium]
MTTLRIYGIRHHGPGSARSLLEALETDVPDIVLVEGPADAQDMLPWVGHAGLKPPVALLTYRPKDLRQTAFFPLAEFSPEWQAIAFALRRQIAVRWIDLPMALAFGLEEAAEGERQQAPRYDPFSDIARMGGYTDPERWWEAHFERQQRTPDAGVFDVVLALMRALREAKQARGIPESRETLLREAFMRREIRRARREGFQRIAVVCGAWHGPALADVDAFPAKDDEALLKPLKRQSTQATWIPWSFDRLARQSGYAAGVLAPAWYQALWEGNAGLERWFARAAQLLRREGFAAPPSQVIEAVRLAQVLAALRGTPLPGIEELRETAVTVLCDGAEAAYVLVEHHLVVGDVLGQTPADVPRTPLMADFEAQVRSARLPMSTEQQALELDLREEAHLRKSRLLHRLGLLGVPWGREQTVRGRKEGRFHEHWLVRWRPEYAVQLIEAGQWGGAIEEAAVHRLRWQLSSVRELAELVALLNAALRADLPDLIGPLLERLEETSAQAQDVLALADAALPLVEALRYGHARRLQVEAVEQLLERLIPRVCVQLPDACVGVQYEAAVETLKRLLSTQRAVDLWRPEEYRSLWQAALQHIRIRGMPLLAGLSTRLLFDQEARTLEEAVRDMQLNLSAARPPLEAAQWLEGFLHGGGLLLLYRPALWEAVNQWVCALEPEAFEQALPLLRRTFSTFGAGERQKLFALAQRAQLRTATPDLPELDAQRVELLRPLLQRLFD